VDPVSLESERNCHFKSLSSRSFSRIFRSNPSRTLCTLSLLEENKFCDMKTGLPE